MICTPDELIFTFKLLRALNCLCCAGWRRADRTALCCRRGSWANSTPSPQQGPLSGQRTVQVGPPNKNYAYCRAPHLVNDSKPTLQMHTFCLKGPLSGHKHYKKTPYFRLKPMARLLLSRARNMTKEQGAIYVAPRWLKYLLLYLVTHSLIYLYGSLK
jgi:hypothetical protein